MEFSIKNGPEATEVALSGRMTFADHEQFRAIIAAFDGPTAPSIVFDVSGLDFVDSSGLGMFIIARDAAMKRQRAFTIRGARDEVKHLITVAKFHKLFNIAE